MAGEDMAEEVMAEEVMAEEEATAEEVDMAVAVTIYFSNYPIKSCVLLFLQCITYCTYLSLVFLVICKSRMSLLTP